jgi:glycerate kinase
MVKILQKGHERLAKVAKRQMGIDMQKISGGGAAGGLGAGLVCFLGADIKNGVDIIFELSNIEEKIKKSSLVITGEGCFDRTSLYGKAPFRIAKLASRYKKPCILICGKYDLPEAVEGVKYVRELRKFAPLIECLKNPRKYIKMAVRHLFNMLAEFN